MRRSRTRRAHPSGPPAADLRAQAARGQAGARALSDYNLQNQSTRTLVLRTCDSNGNPIRDKRGNSDQMHPATVAEHPPRATRVIPPYSFGLRALRVDGLLGRTFLQQPETVNTRCRRVACLAARLAPRQKIARCKFLVTLQPVDPALHLHRPWMVLLSTLPRCFAASRTREAEVRASASDFGLES